MENKLLSFSDFEHLYESYGFINEAEDSATDPLLFDPFAPTKYNSEIASLLLKEPAKNTNEASTINQFSVIKKGEKSERVESLQKDLGFSDKEADGVFGTATETKVKEFQKENKLTIDGIVGVQTLRKILELKKGVEGTTAQDAVITKTYIIKTASDAKAAGIDPALLNVYESVTVVKTGSKTMVICVPKKDAAAQVKVLTGSGLLKANWEYIKNAASAVGKAILYTATGATMITLDIVKAIISSVASACKFVGDGVMYAAGAAFAGLSSVANWVKNKGIATFKTLSLKAKEAFTSFVQGSAKVIKASVQGITAFVNGIISATKTAGYFLTGLTVSAFKSVASVFNPAVKAIVQAAKDGTDFVKKGMVWIGTNIKNGAASFAKMMKSGWDASVKFTTNAYNAGKALLTNASAAVSNAYNSAAKATSNFFSSMYNAGKSFWESACNYFEDSDFIFEDLVWDLDFSSDTEGYYNV